MHAIATIKHRCKDSSKAGPVLKVQVIFMSTINVNNKKHTTAVLAMMVTADEHTQQ